MLRRSNDKDIRISDELWYQLGASVKTLRPKQTDDIDELERLRQISNQRFDSIGYETIKQEKEATLLALKLFGVDYDNTISSWISNPNASVPYLAGLNEGNKAREDPTIQHDIINSLKKM